MASGHFVEVEGIDIWYRTFGRHDSTRPWLVLFHGFPTSSWDWHRLIPLLRPHYRVLVFDFPGYGLSSKPPGRDYSVLRQLDVAEALLTFLHIPDFNLLAHDMGDTVTCELLYRLATGETSLRPVSVTMMNGGIYTELHQPLPTQRMLRTPFIGELTARLSSWQIFKHQYPRVYSDPDSFSDEHYLEQLGADIAQPGPPYTGKSRVLHAGTGPVQATMAGPAASPTIAAQTDLGSGRPHRGLSDCQETGC